MSGEETSSTVGGAGAEFMKSVSDTALMALTSTQKGFIISMMSIPSDLTGGNLREYFAELFPPSVLFCKEICDIPTMWTEIRNYMNARGANLQQHSSRRVIMTLAHGIYDEAEDRDAAVEMAQLILASTRRVRADLRSSDPPHHKLHLNSREGRQVSISWTVRLTMWE